MQAITDTRDATTGDQIWLLDHDPVFTLGQAGKPEHVLAPGRIPVLKVDRGGQVTYHGPAQLIAYPLLDLRRLGIGVRELVTRLEQVGIDLLREFDINAERREGAPGLYVAGRKIMAIGIRVRRGCTFHGIALNADMDLAPFAGINPCGYRGLEVTRIADFGPCPPLRELAERYLRVFTTAFGFGYSPAFASELPQLSTCLDTGGGVRSAAV
jgi:lipoyl(octanoyl) transferase